MLISRGICFAMLGLLAGCTPTVQLAMPSEPININLNVKIEHEIYIKVDKQLDSLFSKSSGLF
jgi:type IV pilus biogenesis protein CpaD/CtpE